MSFRVEHGQLIPSQGKRPELQKPDHEAFEKKLMEAMKKKGLDQQTVKISSHALERMTKREISLSQEDLKKITDTVNHLETKGAKESLLLYKDLAFITSIKNKTIITAMPAHEMDTVTNIDSFANIT